VLTADIRHAIWQAAQSAAADADLPELPELPDPSTLRPVPGAPGGPGHYASTLPFLLPRPPGKTPHDIAQILAPRLAAHAWVQAAEAANGYLTCAVTSQTLTAQAVRIAQATAPAASDILRGMSQPPPAVTPLAAEISQLLARTAGAFFPPVRFGAAPPAAAGPQHASPEAVGEAVAYAGPDAIRYLLIKAPLAPLRPAAVQASVRYHLDNPVYAVRYAHAHASATLRQAAELGFSRGEAAGLPSGLLAHPCERVLLDAMSWLPERVAGAGRRGRPGDMARYLEELARCYHDCRESCPALPFGGRGAPRDESTIRARLWLVTAARAAVGAGLGLLGISAPERL
jgi:arginyl-tRNA synthetase